MCALSLLNNTTHTVDSWHWKKILQEIWYNPMWYEPFCKDENMLLKGRIITHPLIRVYVLFWDKYQCTLLLVRFSRWWETKGNPGSSHSIQQKSLSHECSCCHLRSPSSGAQGAAGCAEAHRCQARLRWLRRVTADAVGGWQWINQTSQWKFASLCSLEQRHKVFCHLAWVFPASRSFVEESSMILF